jgi:hypothetical protein
MLDFSPYCCQITPIPVLRATDALPLPVGNSRFSKKLVSHHQTNNPVAGGALDSGNRIVVAGVTFSSR